MQPYHLACAETSSLLYELSDGRFQFVSGDSTAPLMVGHHYILADGDLTKFLRSLDLDRVQFVPAVIWNRPMDLEIHTHTRVMVGQFFSPDQINDLNLDGNRLLVMNDDNLFVSPSLKEALEAAGFEYLHFSEGLSEFCG